MVYMQFDRRDSPVILYYICCSIRICVYVILLLLLLYIIIVFCLLTLKDRPNCSSPDPEIFLDKEPGEEDQLCI